jgi:hypothetical protein
MTEDPAGPRPPAPEIGQQLYAAGPVNEQPQQQVYAPARGTNGFAVASLVLGILWVFWVGSVLAVVFGHIATSQIDQSGGAQGGRGMAVAGFVLGYIGLGILAAFFIFPFLVAALFAAGA